MSGLAIRTDATGRIELALAVVRPTANEARGYVMNSQEDALFRIVRAAESFDIELWTTAGEPAWSRAWRISADGECAHRALDPAISIEAAQLAELEALAQDFVARWIWFRNGPHEETTIEAGRFAALGCAVADANLRAAAFARLGSGDSLAVRYSELDADGAWIEDALARCWPGVHN